MFCFQCEQTAGCTGCTGRAGVCGKPADTSGLQDALTGALIGLSRIAGYKTDGSADLDHLILEGLFAAVTNVNFDNAAIQALIDQIHAEKDRMASDSENSGDSCGYDGDYDLKDLWNASEDIRSLKSLILFGIRGMAAYAYHAMVLGYVDRELSRFFRKALFAIGEDWTMEKLLPIVLEVGKYNLTCMALLDRANTETFGTPEPTTVSLTIEDGPFIVITGHDLHDLKLLWSRLRERASTFIRTVRCCLRMLIRN